MPAIRRYLYGKDVDFTRTPLTVEFEYRWKLVKDGRFLRQPEPRETNKRWLAQYLSIDGKAANLVLEPKGSIQKANLTFTKKFLLLIVHRFFSPLRHIIKSHGIAQSIW